MDKQL